MTFDYTLAFGLSQGTPIKILNQDKSELPEHKHVGYFLSFATVTRVEILLYYSWCICLWVPSRRDCYYTKCKYPSLSLDFVSLIGQGGVADFWLGARCESGLTDYRQCQHVFLKTLHHVTDSLEDHPWCQLGHHRDTWPVLSLWRGGQGGECLDMDKDINNAL